MHFITEDARSGGTGFSHSLRRQSHPPGTKANDPIDHQCRGEHVPRGATASPASTTDGAPIDITVRYENTQPVFSRIDD